MCALLLRRSNEIINSNKRTSGKRISRVAVGRALWRSYILTYPWFHKLNNTLTLQIYREFKIISKVLKLKLDFVLESVILNISIIHVSNPFFLSKKIHSIKQNWALRTSMVACLYDLSSFPLYKLWWYSYKDAKHFYQLLSLSQN